MTTEPGGLCETLLKSLDPKKHASTGCFLSILNRPPSGQFTTCLAANALSPDEGRLAAADPAAFVQVWDLGWARRGDHRTTRICESYLEGCRCLLLAV